MVWIRARAPLRIGLAGGGTDVYQSATSKERGDGPPAGLVLNASIALYAHALVTPAEGPVNRIRAIGTDGENALLKATCKRFLSLPRCARSRPFTLVTHADVPVGSGLGASSAIVVAALAALAAWHDLAALPASLAGLAAEIEREELHWAGGTQDHYAAAYGGFNTMAFPAGKTPRIMPVPVAADTIRRLERHLILFLATRDQRPHGVGTNWTALPEPVFQALRATALEMREALLAGDMAAVAAGLDRGWRIKQLVSPRIATPRAMAALAAARAAGAMAGRVCGAGQGGYLLIMAAPERRHAVIEALRPLGEPRGCYFTESGVTVTRLAARAAA
jgi:D-glycero-alpha-D-manno-heptose-7-phosphate kinase